MKLPFFIFLDLKGAHFFNHWLAASSSIQLFWSFLNTRMGDIVFDLVVLLFISYLIFFTKKEEKKRQLIVQIIAFFVLWALFQFLSNAFFVKKIIDLYRVSPLGTLSDLIDINQVAHFATKRDYKGSSFPGDHATTCLMFVLGMFHLGGAKKGGGALFSTLPFLIARLVVGGHWITDILFGSLPIAFINCRLIFFLLSSQQTQSILYPKDPS